MSLPTTNVGLLDMKTNKVFSKDLEFIFLEVPKVPKTYYNNLEKWMVFLKGTSKKEVMKMDNSAINKAQETLEYLSQDPVARAKYEARLKYLSDYNTSMYTERQEGINEGMEKGREEAKIQFAKKNAQ